MHYNMINYEQNCLCNFFYSYHFLLLLLFFQVLQSAIWTIGAGRHIGAGQHVSVRPPPIPLVYNTVNLIGVDPHEHSFVYNFVIDLAILQKYYVLTLEL